jgi:hypothetical protein
VVAAPRNEATGPLRYALFRMDHEYGEQLPGIFVNQGLAIGRADKANVLRPLLRQTVSYRRQRGAVTIASGIGWVEEVLGDDPEVSSIFTPLTITINVDAFDSVQFDLEEVGHLRYVLRRGDESIELEYRAGVPVPVAAPLRTWLDVRAEQYVQIELPTSAWPSAGGSVGGEASDEGQADLDGREP